jgi:hypothetical protein
MKWLLKLLYSEDTSLREPKADPVACNCHDVLGPRLEPVVKDVKGYFSRTLGRLPYFERAMVTVEKLPTYVAELYRGGKRLLVPVGKVFGMYVPATNRVYIDPVTLPEMKDPERGMLKHYFKIPSFESVAGEELIHADQANSGIMTRLVRKYGKSAREHIEGAASYVSDLIYGQTGAYQTWKQRFRRLSEGIGLKRAYAGAH